MPNQKLQIQTKVLWHVVAPLLSPGLLLTSRPDGTTWTQQSCHRTHQGVNAWAMCDVAYSDNFAINQWVSDFHPPTGAFGKPHQTGDALGMSVCEWTPVTNHPKDHPILASSGSLPKHVRGKPITHKPLSMHICALPFGGSKPAKKWGRWMV